MNLIQEAQRVIRQQGEHLFRTADLLDPRWEKAVEIIQKSSGKLIVSGMGKAGKIAQKAVATFCSVGVPAVFLHPVEAFHGDLGIVQENDVLLAVSYSGRTDLVNLLPILKGKKVPVISIVGDMKSPLAEGSDIAIDGSILAEACPLAPAPMTSTTVALVLLDALAACLMMVRNFKTTQFAENHPGGALGLRLTHLVGDYMHRGVAKLLASSGAKDILEGLDRTRLGAVLIVDASEKVSGIITDGDVRRKLLALGEGFFQKKASDLMNSAPTAISGKASMEDALKIMENRTFQLGQLPVVDDTGRALGLLRLHDFFQKDLPKLT